MLPVSKPVRRAGWMVRQLLVPVETRRPMQFVDLTDAIDATVWEHGLADGTVVVQTRHTTTGLLVNEHEPLLLDDLTTMFERLVPGDQLFAHDDFTRRVPDLGPAERRNGAAHARAALLRSSETLGVSGRRLALGRWQRLLFVEFDGPQPRQVALTLVGRRTRRQPPRRG